MWIEAIPFAEHLDVFGLIVLGLLVEKHYVSRPSVFANTIAVGSWSTYGSFTRGR